MVPSDTFMPHGHCYHWSPDVLVAHIGSDLLTAIAYFSIPIALLTFAKKRDDLGRGQTAVLGMFILFILACGVSHLMEVFTTYYPWYRAEAGVKAVTAALSVGTAAMLWPLIPKALEVPSPDMLEEANRQLEELNRTLEERVRERTERLEETTRRLRSTKEDLELFTSMASHDLQEPLRIVASYTELLEQRHGHRMEGEAREFLNFARDGALRARELVQDLLCYARVQDTPKAAGIEVREALEFVLDQLRVQIEEADAKIEISGDLGEVSAEPEQLRMVFRNLISNALKYRDKESCQIRIRGVIEQGWAKIRVSDNGIGFDPKHAEGLFEPFNRLHTSQEYTGTGMGLAVCQKIVQNHGGMISAEGRPEEGAAFTIHLPDRRISELPTLQDSDRPSVGHVP